MDQAWKEAQSLKDEYISKAHIVLAMLGANGGGLNGFSQKRTWAGQTGKGFETTLRTDWKATGRTPSLAIDILEHKFQAGDVVLMDREDDHLVFTKKSAP